MQGEEKFTTVYSCQNQYSILSFNVIKKSLFYMEMGSPGL